MYPTRSRILNESQSQDGSIVSEMKAYTIPPVENDGLNIYGNIRVTPDTSAPFSSSQEINLKLTSTNFDIIEFDNSFIHMQLKLRVRFSNAPTVTGSDDFANMLKKNQFVFIGLKSSNQIIRTYSFKHNDVPITTSLQSNGVYEGFLYSAFMSKGERENKKYVFSPYEEVSQLDNSLCGMYVPIGDLVDGVYMNMDLILPYRNLLALSGWLEFCNRIFGELKLVFTVTSDAFVYTQVNPITSIRKGIISGKISKSISHLSEVLAVDPDSFDYKHAFEQVTVPSAVQYISGYDETTSKLTFSSQAEFTPYIDEIIVQDVYADVRGYRVQETALRTLMAYWQNEPFVVPAQRLDTFTFPANATPSGIHSSMNVRFNKCTDAVVLFPRDSRHRTIFTNICYDKLVLQIGTRRFPDTLIATNSPQWFAMQLQSTDFDSIFAANEEWEHSLTDCNTDGEYDLNPVTDNTSFVPIFSFERSNGHTHASTWCDGIDGQVKVEISGNPKYPAHDVYYNGTSMPSPILCCDQESWWIFRLRPDGLPNVQYVINSNYGDAYNNPALERV